MTPDPVVLRHDDPIAVAIHKMAVGGFRHIPIVEDGRPTGVVTARDVFHHLARRSTDAMRDRASRSSPRTSSGRTGWPASVEAAGAEPVRAETAPRVRAGAGRRRLRDHRPDRAGVRPARRHRAGGRRGRPRPGGRPARRRRAAQAGARRAAPTRCSPTASCSRTDRRPSPPGSAGRWPARDDRRPRARSSRPSATPSAWSAPARRPPRPALDALLIGVGSDLRYLTGYEAMPLERLTMLVVTPGRRPGPRRAAPGARRGRGRAADRRVEIATWDETDDPYALGVGRAARLPVACRGVGHDAGDARAAAPGGARAAAPAFELASGRPARAADGQGRRRDRAAAAGGPGRRPGRRPRSRPGRLVGRTEADVAREVRERLIAEGHEEAHFAIVGSGPELGVAAPRGVGAGHPGRRADRARHRRHARRLRLGHHADAVGDRRRPGQRARTSASVTCSASCTTPRRPARAAVRPGVAVRGDRRRRARADRGRGLRRGVLPSDRARHRARGPRGPVPHRRQRPAARAGHGLQRRARDLPAGRVRRPDRGHRRVRRRTARSSSTRRRASCTSSTAEPTGPADGRPAVSSPDALATAAARPIAEIRCPPTAATTVAEHHAGQPTRTRHR